ncbi:Uncharacterized protein TCM_020702 [Theobroma cacao]|uniref:Uncharacterized protein n=1 Tax=Theobroma cacao TaxID=3641 RepID=A0A061EN57_THECC|nr:Uncharacterized protein TCM_020702 [Theobroma cacao]
MGDGCVLYKALKIRTNFGCNDHQHHLEFRGREQANTAQKTVGLIWNMRCSYRKGLGLIIPPFCLFFHGQRGEGRS